MVFPSCLLIALPFLPESPRWLALQGRSSEAQAALLKLRVQDRDSTSIELRQIQQQIEVDRNQGRSWFDILKKPSHRKRAMLTFTCSALGQCTGILVINTYGPILYKNLGYETRKQLLYAAAILTFGFGTGIAGTFIVDRFSRPRIFALGLATCGAALLVEAVLTALYVPSNNHTALNAAVAMFFVFRIFYSMLVDSTVYAYCTEMWPNYLRGKSSFINIAAICVTNLIWLQVGPTAVANIGWRFYLCFIVISLVGAVWTFLFCPDTRGLPLEEIAASFGDADEVVVYQTALVRQDGAAHLDLKST